MRVALACPYAWDAPGGVREHVAQLASHLRALGHETLILAPAHRDRGGQGVRVVGRPVRVRFNGSIAPICPDPRSLPRIRDALAAFTPDVVHVHEPFAPSTSLYATIASREPLVATSHTFAERPRLLIALRPFLRRVWQRPALWLAVSQANASLVRRVVDGAIRVVPNGVDVAAFHEAEPTAGLPAGRRVLFVSRLEPRKGFAVAVRAFGALAGEWPDLQLVVAGSGPEARAVGDLPPGLRDRVRLLGSVPHAQLPGYYAACQVFVAPATGRESFGVVLVEAMAAGLPVIASDIPGFREVVRPGDGLLVPPGDAHAVASAIGRVLGDAELATTLGAAGRKRSQRYAWSAVVPQIEQAYRDALAAAPASTRRAKPR